MPGQVASSWVMEGDHKRRLKQDGSSSTSSAGPPRSKRFKYGLALATVYATTLTKLRTGAKKSFENPASAQSAMVANDLERMDISSEDLQETIDDANSSVTQGASSGLADASAISSLPTGVSPLNDICENCMRNRRDFDLNKSQNLEACSFCERKVCHLNLCVSCKSGFCGNCSYHKYDEDGFGEAFVCTDCFQ